MQNKVGATRAAACGPSCVEDRQKLRSRRGFIGAAMLAGAMAALLVSKPAAAAPATLEGTLETIVEDHPDHGRTRHFLKTDKDRVELRFAKRAPALLSDSRLRVSGELSGNVLALADSGSSSLSVTAMATLQNTAGEHKVAVLLVNFQDDRTRPFTVAQADDVMFNQVSRFVRENSAQRAWIAGQSFGWFELPIARTCDGGVIATQANAAAAMAGIDLSGYGRVAYVFPENSVCGWGGSATLGGTRPSIWINGWLTLGVVGHEFGHTLGLYHTHSLECGATTLGSACTQYEYGDAIDIMGNRSAGHLSASHKERLGWLEATTISASGRYSIEAYSAPNGNLPKALKVRRGTHPTAGTALWYYIEYRQPVGQDAALSALSGFNVLRGLVVRSVTEGDGNSTAWLDVTPGSSSFDDWSDAALGFGQSYVDPAAGVTIVAVAGDGNTAQLDVTLNATACARAIPTISLTGPSLAVPAGSTITYALSLANKDSAGCPASAFDLRAGLPSGWSGSLGATNVSMQPGASASTTLAVTSPVNAPAGSQPIAVTVMNATAPALSASASTAYTVAAGTIAASVATDKPSYRAGETVAASARLMSGTSPVAGASVSFAFTKANGQTVVKTTTTDTAGFARVGYRIARKDPSGAWQVAGSSGGVAAKAEFSVQ